MSILSSNQNVNIRYKSEVTSIGHHAKMKEIYGGGAKIEGLILTPSVGLDCSLSAGKLIVGGATIEETAPLIIPIPPNSTGLDKTYYVYGLYIHGADAVCTYDVLSSPTPAETATLIAKVTIADSATTIYEENIVNESYSASLSNAVSFSDKDNRIIEDVDELSVGDVPVQKGNTGAIGINELTIDGVVYVKKIVSTDPLNPINSISELYMADDMKKKAGGVAAYDTAANNATAIGNNGTAIGNNASAISGNTTAINNNATAISDSEGVILSNTGNINSNTVAIGVNATAISNNGTAIGNNTGAINGKPNRYSGSGSFSIGPNNTFNHASCTTESLVRIFIQETTEGDKVGDWKVVSNNGSFTITTDVNESKAIPFKYEFFTGGS